MFRLDKLLIKLTIDLAPLTEFDIALTFIPATESEYAFIADPKGFISLAKFAKSSDTNNPLLGTAFAKDVSLLAPDTDWLIASTFIPTTDNE